MTVNRNTSLNHEGALTDTFYCSGNLDHLEAEQHKCQSRNYLKHLLSKKYEAKSPCQFVQCHNMHESKGKTYRQNIHIVTFLLIDTHNLS